ncbi:hypothetical protein HNQ80_000540 [Anaerosolibacter carboniphilus]|uniref:Uncharacterized protein n=1 Tax=Anaerosolibacter carboniphilus TaxID=1417629 RepID=A0A841KQT9_9FIRM|nr:hypothetical protein [Anaerosolibacter carboniphilus]MBB6214460.1 hypothetical protein [Anaerosolibacter carboniphilus]
MKILINKISRMTEDIIVDFSMEFGSGKAAWNGYRKPEQGKQYNVEYDITDPLRWEKDVVLSKEKNFKIFMKQGTTFITGILEKVYNDGVADLRFGKSIIQLEIQGKNIPKGQYVEVKADSLEVYDVNY